MDILELLLGAAIGSILTEGISAYRQRARLKLRLGAATAIGRSPTAWIDIQNAGGKATTVCEVGLYAKRMHFETRRLEGEMDATFPFGCRIFLEPGETRRFEGAPDIDTFGLTRTSPFVLTQLTSRTGECGGVPGLLCAGS